MTKTTTANLSENLVHADDALRVSEAKYRSLFDLSPVAVYLLDGAGNFLSANAAGAQLLKILCTGNCGHQHPLDLPA